MASVVIIGSLLLAAAYTAGWLLGPALRRQIEDPKHWFDDQTRQYDRMCHEQREHGELGSNDTD